ncbi:MAG: hypothetical protein IPL46_06085 [Saprospiraceae bacterium]|nr:hypothetical protein [Saprospiraceae bacterium]
MKKVITLLQWGLFLFLLSCQGKPKVIQPVTEMDGAPAGMMEEDPKMKIHEVVVNDFMDASRYTYLNVTEGENTFWIAIPYSEVEKGKTYYYRGGVLMNNFESKEHNRVFETLYLVSGVSKTPSLDGFASASMPAVEDEVPRVGKVNPIAGGTSFSELFSRPSDYNDKSIIVTGQCVKVNRNIMGKNWIHLQDGSKDASDNNLDLTISTMEEVNIGDVVTFEGKIATNRDFGAGYRYDLIMEEAIRK